MISSTTKKYSKENLIYLTPILIASYLTIFIAIWALGYSTPSLYFLFGFIAAIIIIKVIPKFVTKFMLRFWL